MKKNYQITTKGRQALEEELETLKGRRTEIAEKIATAREYGDLRENAEYDGAREEQGIVETRISEIENILQSADIIKSEHKDSVDLGSEVELKTGDQTVNYTIVGPVEADPLNGMISNQSPIGIALMGKKVGETAVIKTAKKEIEYEIVSIK